MPKQSKIQIALAAGKDFSEIGSLFLPIPALAPILGVLSEIAKRCEEMSSNKHAARTLRDRCCVMIWNLQDVLNAADRQEGPVKDALEAIYRCLSFISNRMNKVGALSIWQQFTKLEDIKADIEECHTAISDSVERFQLISQVGLVDWTQTFQAEARRDHEELMERLSQLNMGQAETNVHLSQNTMQIQNQQSQIQQQTEVINTMMETLQNFMRSNKDRAENIHDGLASNLHTLQRFTGHLLPNLYLNAGEVEKIGNFAVAGNANTDVYEGRYLKREKVSLKVMRSLTTGPQSSLRFQREVKIWHEVWRLDHGQHILPFYGVCDNDGPFPYLVSPWMNNGNALQYVKMHDRNVDHINMIKRIARGIQILHTMNPPIIHGDIKCATIMIDDSGNPLLADFGLSKIEEDITGVPFTQSRGVSDSYRWCAPELCRDPGHMSQSSDVYAFGKTILELMTHMPPHREIKHPADIVIRINNGEHPIRPTEPEVIARGFSDGLWELLRACWTHPVSGTVSRPSIQQVVQKLDEL